MLWKQIAESERGAKLGQKDLRLMLPDLPRRYSKETLYAAYNYERGSGNYPFNPRALQPETLLDIDLEFMTDFENFKKGIEWAEDLDRRPPSMKD
jgi:hypothetical protein